MMLFNINHSKFFTEIRFYGNLFYYRYFNPYAINHYNVINKLITYKSIGLNYYNKYPNAQFSANLNKKLFDSNPKAKEEFEKSMELQNKIKKYVISDINTICESEKKFEIGSEKFQSFYIKYDYHIEQNIDAMIECVKKDIIKNDII